RNSTQILMTKRKKFETRTLLCLDNLIFRILFVSSFVSDFDIRISDFVSLRSPDLVWGMLCAKKFFLRDLRVLLRGELPVSELCVFAGDYSRFWLRLWRVTLSLPLLWREPPPDRGAGLPSKNPRFPAARCNNHPRAGSADAGWPRGIAINDRCSFGRSKRNASDIPAH